MDLLRQVLVELRELTRCNSVPFGQLQAKSNHRTKLRRVGDLEGSEVGHGICSLALSVKIAATAIAILGENLQNYILFS